MVVSKIEKLICNVNNKENNIFHIKAVQQVLNHGLKIAKVHKAIV